VKFKKTYALLKLACRAINLWWNQSNNIFIEDEISKVFFYWLHLHLSWSFELY